MKNYETKEEAFKGVIKSIKGINTFYGDGRTTIVKFVQLIKDSTSYAELLAKTEKLFSKENYNGYLYSMAGYRDIFLLSNKSGGQFSNRKDIPERFFFEVGGTKHSILSLNENITDEDYLDLAKKHKEKHFINELVYEHLVMRKKYSQAKEVIKNEIDNSSDFIIESDSVFDFIPLFDSMKNIGKDKPKNLLKMLESYLIAFYSKKNPVDSEFNNKIHKTFKSDLKKLNFSQFVSKSFNESSREEVKKNDISPFDLLESNLSFRRNIFMLSSWENNRFLRELIEKDKERTEFIIITHFNNEHRNGVRKSLFLRSYRKIKKLISVDVFKLDPKLQSYILLEEIN
jgi:hypothetical protein